MTADSTHAPERSPASTTGPDAGPGTHDTTTGPGSTVPAGHVEPVAPAAPAESTTPVDPAATAGPAAPVPAPTETDDPPAAPASTRTDTDERPVDDAGSAKAGEQWREVLLGFVDDPRKAVEQADGLVEEAVRSLRERIDAERSDLREAWRTHGEPSTEELRTALRGYRDFFDKVLGYDRGPRAGSPS